MPLSALAADMLPTRAAEERSEQDWRTPPQAAGTHAVEALGRELGAAPEADKAALVSHCASSTRRCSRSSARVGSRLRIGVI